MLVTSDEKRLPHRVGIHASGVFLEGDLELPLEALGVILFPHGSGIGSREIEELLAFRLRAAGLGTLLLNLLTDAEQKLDARTACFRFDSALLADRLVGVIRWLADLPTTHSLPIGCFATGTATSAVLAAADQFSGGVGAVILYDAQTDQAAQTLSGLTAPTLLMVDGTDEPLFKLSRTLRNQLGAGDKQLKFVPGSRYILDEPGALDEVSELATGWFTTYLELSARRYIRKPR